MTRLDVITAQWHAVIDRLLNSNRGSTEYNALVSTAAAIFAEYQTFATRPEYV